MADLLPNGQKIMADVDLLYACDEEKPEARALKALEAGGAHSSTSLDQPANESDNASGSPQDRMIGHLDAGFAQVDNREAIERVMLQLPDREREVIRMRFYENLSQPEIAERIGVSQSYLSRILRRTLVELRNELERSTDA